MPSPKSKEANLEHTRSSFLLIGYVVALSVFYVMLEWRSGGVSLSFFDDDEYVFREDFIPITWDIPEEIPPVEEDFEIDMPVPAVEPTVSNEVQVIHPDSTRTSTEEQKRPEAGKETPKNEVKHQALDRMPEFPGGIAALRRYIYKNLIYPYEAVKAGVDGTVLCSFIVTEEGKITDLQIIEGKTPEMDAEATRVILQMPRWKPGIKNGQAIPVRYVLPIVFRLK